MEGRRHNVEALAEDSPADNVLLEYELGLCLNELHGTAIMPLFVGDKDDSGRYSHFFESKCLPACKEVTVKSISEKVSNYLENDAGCTGGPDQTVQTKICQQDHVGRHPVPGFLCARAGV